MDIKAKLFGMMGIGTPSSESAGTKTKGRGFQITARLDTIHHELSSLKGWGPEVKEKRAGLEAEKRALITELNAFGATHKNSRLPKNGPD